MDNKDIQIKILGETIGMLHIEIAQLRSALIIFQKEKEEDEKERERSIENQIREVE